MQAKRAFEPVVNAPEDTILPKRGSKHSAGYDFYAAEDINCRAHSVSKLSFTNIKVRMPENEYLAIMIRSSLAVNRGLQVAQGTAVIDADYYSNPTNDGNIGIAIVNNSGGDYIIRKGERFCQGIFHKYEVTDDDNAEGERTGGYGSSGRF
jgi:dUTP pyrophosphatase